MTTVHTIDPMTLETLADHPELAELRRRLQEAETARRDQQAREVEARATLQILEDRAARGDRDPKRLREAREALDEHQANLRIATRAVELAEEAYDAALPDVAAAVNADLRRRHLEAVRAFDQALAAAAAASRRVAEIEERHARVFTAASRPADGLLAYGCAWLREFGGSSNRYTDWRDYNAALLEDSREPH